MHLLTDTNNYLAIKLTNVLFFSYQAVSFNCLLKKKVQQYTKSFLLHHTLLISTFLPYYLSDYIYRLHSFSASPHQTVFLPQSRLTRLPSSPRTLASPCGLQSALTTRANPCPWYARWTEVSWMEEERRKKDKGENRKGD